MELTRLDFALPALVLFCTATAQAQTVTVPVGTEVPILLMENVHSSFNTRGESIYLQAAADIDVNGSVVVAKGARVEAEVGDVAGTGILGKAGSVSFHPVRIAAVDGQWLPLDPTTFGAEGEGAGGGAVFAIGLFAKGHPGFVQRGTSYRATIRRDTSIDVGRVAGKRDEQHADVVLSGKSQPVADVKPKKSKSGAPVEIDLAIPPDMVSAVQSGTPDISAVSFNGYTISRPVTSTATLFDAKRSTLKATFEWWSVVRHTQTGSNNVIVQLKLADGRLALADVALPVKWDLE